MREGGKLTSKFTSSDLLPLMGGAATNSRVTQHARGSLMCAGIGSGSVEIVLVKGGRRLANTIRHC